MTGCWSVKTSGSGPTGEWKSWRSAVASDVSGLNSAIWRSPSGRPATGTKIPHRNIAGKMIAITMPSAPSGSRTIRPTHTPAQVTAKAMNSSSANAPAVSSTLPCGAQPTIRPQSATTSTPPQSSTSSATVRPAITEPRAIGSVRSRSIRPERMSDATPTAIPGSVPIIVWAKIPDTR